MTTPKTEMTPTKSVEDRLRDLKAMRDEMQVRIHLGALEAREAWDRLTLQLENVERNISIKGSETAGEIASALDSLSHSFKEFSDRHGHRPS